MTTRVVDARRDEEEAAGTGIGAQGKDVSPRDTHSQAVGGAVDVGEVEKPASLRCVEP